MSSSNGFLCHQVLVVTNGFTALINQSVCVCVMCMYNMCESVSICKCILCVDRVGKGHQAKKGSSSID